MQGWRTGTTCETDKKVPVAIKISNIRSKLA
jgi:hypothetical protein